MHLSVPPAHATFAGSDFEFETMQALGEKAPPPWWSVAIFGRDPRVTLVRLVITVFVILALRQYVILPVHVQGISMLPTFPNGGIRFVNRLAYLSSEPQRGDVVAIRYAGEHLMLLKRIVGLPGETVAFQDGRLYINGRPIPEPYLKLPCDWDLPPETLGPNEFYAVGDNRSMPAINHEKGIADRERIVGKIL